jgi:hypothetical protein
MLWILGTTFLSFSAGAPAGTPRIEHLIAIPVHDGINLIRRFSPDGRAAIIVRAWRDNGNAHGHFVYLVTLPLAKETGRPEMKTGVVAVERDNGLEDTIGASPFDGERVLQEVRFVHARLNGSSVTLLVRADLGESASGVLADHAQVEIQVYRLEHPGVEVGTAPDVFRLVSRFKPPGLFCNADMALATVMHVALPRDYAGGKGPSGCSD